MEHVGPPNYFLVGGDAQCHVDDARTSSEFMFRVNSVCAFSGKSNPIIFYGKNIPRVYVIS